MPLLRRRLLAAVLALAVVLLAGAATAQTTRVTFVLVNDIYLMSDQLMADGKQRGGFARLAAVVKAERAKARASGGHVIFAHAGDTLSPSLMSGIDRGEHIITLTNLIPPDIFAPGNHEFDFGKAIFLQRMAEAKFPLYAANLRGPDGQPLPNFKDRSIVTVDGVRIGLTGATYRRLGARVEPGGPQVPAHGRDHQRAGGGAAPRGRRFRRGRHSCPPPAELRDFRHPHGRSDPQRPHPRSVHQLRRPQRHRRIELRRALRDGDRRDDRGEAAGRPPRDELVAAIPRHRHRDGDARSGRWRRWSRSFEQELSKELDVPLGTTAVELDSRNATVRSARPRSAT